MKKLLLLTALLFGLHAESVTALKKTCSMNNGEKCTELGILHYEGQVVKKDYMKAKKYFNKSCNLNDAIGCSYLGLLYRSGLGVKRDYVKARKYSKKGCELNHGGGCHDFGLLYVFGQGVKKDYSKAKKYFSKACDLNSRGGCHNLGLLYEDGLGVRRDYSKARKYYSKACDLNGGLGCTNLGLLYIEGMGVRRDISKGMKYIHKGCKLKNSEACSIYKELKRQSNIETQSKKVSVPAIELAQSYLSAKLITQYVLPAAKSGINIYLGSKLINKSNVEEYESKYQGRLLRYREEIKQRGYKTISGQYRASATKSCARIQSAWVSLIHEGRANNIKITQDGFDAEVIVSTIHKGKKLSLKNQAAVVESSIVLQDETNTDYFFRGEIKHKSIEIKPDVSVLRSWPKWAGPPSKKDLENCTITLRRK